MNGHGGKRDGAGRPIQYPEGKTIKVCMSIPDGLVQAISRYAKRHDMSKSQAVGEAIRKLTKTD